MRVDRLQRRKLEKEQAGHWLETELDTLFEAQSERPQSRHQSRHQERILACGDAQTEKHAVPTDAQRHQGIPEHPRPWMPVHEPTSAVSWRVSLTDSDTETAVEEQSTTAVAASAAQQPVTAANEQSATVHEELSATAVAASSVAPTSYTHVPDDLLRRLCYWQDRQGHKWTIRTGPGEVIPCFLEIIDRSRGTG